MAIRRPRWEPFRRQPLWRPTVPSPNRVLVGSTELSLGERNSRCPPLPQMVQLICFRSGFPHSDLSLRSTARPNGAIAAAWLRSCSSPCATPLGWPCIIAGTRPRRSCRFRLMSRRIAPLALAGFFGTEHLARSTPRQHRIAPHYIAQYEEPRFRQPGGTYRGSLLGACRRPIQGCEASCCAQAGQA